MAYEKINRTKYDCSGCPLQEACGVAGALWSKEKNSACQALQFSAYNTLNGVIPGLPPIEWEEARAGQLNESVRALAEIAHRRQMPVQYPGSVAVAYITNSKERT